MSFFSLNKNLFPLRGMVAELKKKKNNFAPRILIEG